jgi:hypothetical protein
LDFEFGFELLRVSPYFRLFVFAFWAAPGCVSSSNLVFPPAPGAGVPIQVDFFAPLLSLAFFFFLPTIQRVADGHDGYPCNY